MTRKNVLFAVGSALIVFIGSFITQPAVLTWLSVHPLYDALITAVGVAFHGVSIYIPKSQPDPQN